MAATTRKAYASTESVIQAGIEATHGTPASTKFSIPVKGPKYKPNQLVIPDDTMQGTMLSVYDQVNGLRYDGHGWDSYPYLLNFPIFVRAELGSTDHLTTAPTSTVLTTAVAKGATTIKTTGTVAAGDWITFGTGATTETHRVKSVTGTYTLTLTYPTLYAHAATATVTGLTGHSFSLLNTAGTGNQPPSCTLWDFDGERCRQMTGCQLDDLTLKGNATGFVDYTTTWFGNPATKVTEPSPTFSGEAPPGWTATASIGGTQVTTVETWQFDFKRGVKPIPALTGNPEYFKYFAGKLMATGKLTFVEQATSPELTAFLTTETKALDIQLYDIKSGFALRIHSTKAKYKAGDITRGSEWVKVPMTIQLLPSTTDAVSGGGGRSPVEITVANSQATSY